MQSEPWWRDAVFYEVYIRSLADTDGDGVGDLEGLRRKLPYLADLGVDAIWVTPFYPSPMHDHGYDVADYCNVDPRFGSLADVDALVAEAHAAGLRIVIDVVPNHTSSDHAWFREAIADPTSPKRDWYIFRPARDGVPPNNWQSVFGGPAWQRDDASGEFYLHLFDASQPDLNWRNPDVHEAFHSVLRFWLDRGVDGFRIDVAHALYKDEALRDDPVGAERSPYAWDQPETLEVWKEWRRLVDSYDDRMLVGEVFLYDPDRVAQYVGADRLHQAFNFSVARTPFEADAFREIVQRSLQLFCRPGTTATWVLSNHDLVRHPTRFGGGDIGVRRGRAATALLLALPGSPYVYQGEELGLEQSSVPPELRQDPVYFRSGRDGRDGCRTPMPWTADPLGHGFTSGAAWLPFDKDAASRNVEIESGDEQSTLWFYRRCLQLRREVVRSLGEELTWVDAPDQMLAWRRGWLTVATNFGDTAEQLALDGEVLLSSAGAPVMENGKLSVPAATTVWLRVSG
ncbi:MAG TPA: alpha-amylase family glycosyl hydrolase [Mycobacteriales bacterium]|nr:alpha-amylase family glycosyl hydrolase [Mycobacteriales bacterium]